MKCTFVTCKSPAAIQILVHAKLYWNLASSALPTI